MVLGALRSALSAKLADEKLTVVDGWTLGSHKTKEFRQTLARLDGKTRTMLVVESSGKPQSRAGQPQPRGREAGCARRRCSLTTCCGTTALMLSKEAALRLGRSLGQRDRGAAAADDRADCARRPCREQAGQGRSAEAQPRPRKAGESRQPAKAARDAQAGGQAQSAEGQGISDGRPTSTR